MEHGEVIMGLLQKGLVLRLVRGWSRNDMDDVNERDVEKVRVERGGEGVEKCLDDRCE